MSPFEEVVCLFFKSTLEGNEVVMGLAIEFLYLTSCKLQKVGYLKKLLEKKVFDLTD